MTGSQAEAWPEIDQLIGRMLAGRYRVEAMLGFGGMGAVYRADDTRLRRPVAIKVLRPECVKNEELRARFEREAHAVARVAHPLVVPVTDYGIDDNMPFLVMEHLVGQTLRELIDESAPLTVKRTADLLSDVLTALAYAHEAGLVHRDLKPANIFLQQLAGSSKDHVRVLDFGLAKFVFNDEPDPLTKKGVVFGTPSYMAPEQASGELTDARTDLYAVGVLVYELVTSEKPFDGTAIQIVQQQLIQPVPVLPYEFDPDGSLNRVIQKATAKSPDQRFQSAAAFLEALKPFRRAKYSTAPPPSRTPAPTVPQRSFLLPLVLAGAVLFALSVITVGVALVFLGGDEETSASEASTSEDAAEAVFSETTAGADTAEEDLWGGDSAPRVIALAREQIQQDSDISDVVKRELQLFSREHPDDARPYLLMARVYMLKNWRPDAIDRYERAFQADPRARTDPQMFSDLLSLLDSDRLGGRAQRAMERIYNRDALPAVEAALENETNDAVRARLTTIRDSLDLRD